MAFRSLLMLPVRYTVLKTFTSRYTNVFGSLIGNYSQTSTQWLLLGQKKNNCSRQHFNIDHQSSIPHGLPTMSWDIRQLFFVCNYTPAPRRGRGVYCFTSVRPSKIFFVAFFSVTVDGRNLIFGHKLHIGTTYRGKRFLTRQIPTFCLPKSGDIISEHQLTVHLVYIPTHLFRFMRDNKTF